MQKTNYLFYVLIGLITVGLLYLLSPVLTPFLAAGLLAYLTDPIVEKMTQYHIPRLLSVIIVFVILFGFFLLLFLLLIPLFQKQIITLIEYIAQLVAWVQKIILPWITSHFGDQEGFNFNMIETTFAENWTKAGGVVTWVLKTAFHSGLAMVELITNLVLIPVVTFYLLRDWNLVIANARDLLPRHIEPVIVKLIKQCNEVLSAFFRGQLLVMLSLGVIYSVGLTIVGIKIGLMIGLIAGLVSIVPYLGFIVGIVSASIAAYAQYGTLTPILYVWIVFAVGQALESMVLTPRLVGHSIGLHPVAVIFSVLAGGYLFGFFGVLLALPAAAVIMVLLRFLNQQYHDSRLYNT